MRQEKWDERFLRLAREYSYWSKDPSTKVGAVIVRDVNRQVSQGYNGFAADDPDLPEDYLDRPTKLSKIIHAEQNAIDWANQDLDGCTLYTYPMQPCHVCAEKHVIPAGIVRVVSLVPSWYHLQRWQKSFEKSSKLFAEQNIELELYEGIF